MTAVPALMFVLVLIAAPHPLTPAGLAPERIADELFARSPVASPTSGWRSFRGAPPIRLLRDLTRYRASLVMVRTAEKNRVEKLLEDAQIKLSSVVSDIFGVSGREMLAALLVGERRPAVLAQLARTAGVGGVDLALGACAPSSEADPCSAAATSGSRAPWSRVRSSRSPSRPWGL